MFVKRYIANDLSEAMEKIRRELGPDAVILSHRAVGKKGISGLFKKKIVEVMVAYEPAPDKPIRLESAPVQTVEAPDVPSSFETRPQEPAEEGFLLPEEENRETPPRANAQSENQREEEKAMQGILQYQQAAMHARYAAGQQAYPGGTQEEVLQAEKAARTVTAAWNTPAAEEPAPAVESREAQAPQAFPGYAARETPEPEAAAQENAGRENEERIDALTNKLQELQALVKALTSKIITVDRESVTRFPPDILRLYNTLLDQDVLEELARGICERVQEKTEETNERPEAAVRELLLRMLGEPAPCRVEKGRQKVLLLTGPTGVGKTTTLVKLAGSYILSDGLSVGFINTDTYRVAAQEQLRVYADIMDIPCCTVYAPEEIPLAMHTLKDCDLILVDTAGKSMGNQAYQEELRALIDVCGGDAIEILLHVSAGMSARACTELMENVSFIRNYKLVITKLDESTVWGNVLNIAAYAKKPVAFVTMGQNVPQDIEAPNMRRIADKILESEGA